MKGVIKMRCIDANASGSMLVDGAIYEVEGYNSINSNFCNVKILGEWQEDFYKSRFKIIEETKKMYIRCLDNTGFEHKLTVSKIYEVISFKNKRYKIKDDAGNNNLGFMERRFKIVNGVIVKCDNNNGYTQNITVGELYEAKVFGSGNRIIDVIDNRNSAFGYYAYRFELIRESSEDVEKKIKGEIKMSRNDIIEKIEVFKKKENELKEEIQKLEEELLLTKENWTPKFDEIYYYIDSDGDVEYTTNDEFDLDIKRIEVLNVFETEELAQFEANARKFHQKLRKFALDNNESKIDWKDRNTYKHYFYVDSANELRIGNTSRSRCYGQVYFTSSKIAQLAKDEFKEEFNLYFVTN